MNINVLPWMAKVIRLTPIPKGLDFPPLLLLGFYAHFVARLLEKYENVREVSLYRGLRTVRQRFDNLACLETCWSILFSDEEAEKRSCTILLEGLISFLRIHLPEKPLDQPYHREHYDAPSDTMNELYFANKSPISSRIVEHPPMNDSTLEFISLHVLFGQLCSSSTVPILMVESGAARPRAQGPVQVSDVDRTPIQGPSYGIEGIRSEVR